MTTPSTPHDHPGQPAAQQPQGSDVLGDVLPAAPGRRPLRAGVAAAAVAGILSVTGAGVAAAFALSGGGAQPEDVVPGDALAFVKLDLDPSAGQKLNVFRLTQRFPDAAEDLTSADSLRDDVLRLVLRDAETGIDYDEDVKPWLGDRVGIAALPSGEQEPDVLVALAYTDRDKAEQALREGTGDEPVEYAFVDDYVLLSDERSVVEQAARAQSTLSEQEAFTDAVDALDGDQVALAWTDLGRVWEALPDEVRAEAAGDGGLGELDPTGQLVVGLRAEPDAVEVVGRTVGVRTGLEAQDALSTGKGTGLVGELPVEAVGALSVAGLDDSLTAAYDDLVTALEAFAPDLEAQAGELGIELPGDLAKVIGSETAVGVWGEPDAPEGLLRTRTDDPDGAVAVLERAYEAAGGDESGVAFQDYVAEREDGLAIGTPSALAADGATLSSSERFTKAVPDFEDAGFVAWFSIQDGLRLSGQAPSPDTDPLEALGLTANGGADGEFRLRLTFR